MTYEQHREFVNSVHDRSGLAPDNYDPSNERIFEQAVVAMRSQSTRVRLLGQSLVAWAIDWSIDQQDSQRLTLLAGIVASEIETCGAVVQDDFILCGLQLRSALFWYYLCRDSAEPALIKTGARLLTACLAARPCWDEQAEFILTQSYRVNKDGMSFREAC